MVAATRHLKAGGYAQPRRLNQIACLITEDAFS